MELVAAGTDVEGVSVAPLRVQPLDGRQLRLEVAEGRYHEVRAICEAAGLAVQASLEEWGGGGVG